MSGTQARLLGGSVYSIVVMVGGSPIVSLNAEYPKTGPVDTALVRLVYLVRHLHIVAAPEVTGRLSMAQVLNVLASQSDHLQKEYSVSVLRRHFMPLIQLRRYSVQIIRSCDTNPLKPLTAAISVNAEFHSQGCKRIPELAGPYIRFTLTTSVHRMTTENPDRRFSPSRPFIRHTEPRNSVRFHNMFKSVRMTSSWNTSVPQSKKLVNLLS